MPTMNDVAKLAKVSVATVSFAFNKPDRVKPETLQRVLDSAKTLNYQPNMFAQSLKGGTSKLVAILLADLRLPIAATVAKGVEDVFLENDYLPIISSTRGDSAETIQRLKHLRQRGVGGFIILPSYFGIDVELAQTIRALSVSGVPIAYVGDNDPEGYADSIHYDSITSARDVVDYLISIGHRRIGFIGSEMPQHAPDKRLVGYKNSLLANQIEPSSTLIELTEINPQSAYEAMARLFAQPNPPTAVLAINDVVAFGVLDYCKDAQLKIPDDVSIVTYDYQTLSRRVTSHISSVVLPGEEAGRTLAQLLIQRQLEPQKPPQNIAIKPTFEIRHSTMKLSSEGN